MLQHSGGLFTLSVWGRWRGEDGVRGALYHLFSGSAPSQCPADPRAARNERLGETHWRYRNKQWKPIESSGISVRCKKCVKSDVVEEYVEDFMMLLGKMLVLCLLAYILQQCSGSQ